MYLFILVRLSRLGGYYRNVYGTCIALVCYNAWLDRGCHQLYVLDSEVRHCRDILLLFLEGVHIGSKLINTEIPFGYLRWDFRMRSFFGS